jgi:hypothetical protein
MMRPSTLAIVVLAGTTTAFGALAWQQYQRAERLAQVTTPAAPLEPTPALRTEAPVSAELEPATATATVPGDVGADEASEAPTRFRGRADPSQRFNALMEDPTFATAWQAQQKARLDDRYAALFRRLNLSPQEIDAFKTLLVERQSARMDVMAAARSEGLGRENRADLRQLMQETDAEIERSIRDLLGSGRFDQYQHYERTAAQRTVVGQLETRLSYSSAPLTPAQTEALVSILAETTSLPPGPTRTENVFLMTPPGGSPTPVYGGGLITDAAITRAQGILSPAQIEGLRQLQAEQQSQQQMQELMRQRFQGGGGGGGGWGRPRG